MCIFGYSGGPGWPINNWTGSILLPSYPLTYINLHINMKAIRKQSDKKLSWERWNVCGCGGGRCVTTTKTIVSPVRTSYGGYTIITKIKNIHIIQIQIITEMCGIFFWVIEGLPWEMIGWRFYESIFLYLNLFIDHQKTWEVCVSVYVLMCVCVCWGGGGGLIGAQNSYTSIF